VSKFGPLKLGGDMPLGPGHSTFYPYKTVPKSKFYVFIAEKDFWCVFEDCGLDGAYIETMGGWLGGENLNQAEIAYMFGFDIDRIEKKYHSVMVVGDADAKIVGIFPNKGMSDLLPVLRSYPKLADFNLIKGVNQFGPLKIGEKTPIKIGDPTGYKPGILTNYKCVNIPEDRKFYIFAFQKGLTSRGFCAMFECQEQLRPDYVESLGGWFANTWSPENARKFGLDPDAVVRGDTSLVVVTDWSSRIVAIHPNKTTNDFLPILLQLPELIYVPTSVYFDPLRCE